MRIRSFIIAYGLVLVILLFADRRPGAAQPDRYSHVVDLTAAETATAPRVAISPGSPGPASSLRRLSSPAPGPPARFHPSGSLRRSWS